ncbi:hypothetical protein VPH35_009052 [Triticum aestivum]
MNLFCLYKLQKKKGKFQHSSFLAGGATSAARKLVAQNGTLKAIWPHSGHYRPTEENFQEFKSFLNDNLLISLMHLKKLALFRQLKSFKQHLQRQKNVRNQWWRARRSFRGDGGSSCTPVVASASTEEPVVASTPTSTSTDRSEDQHL